MTSEESPAELFTRFVETFTAEDHPAVVAMSGGEALLRPALVQRIAEQARTVGTRSTVLSGMFFASAGRIPPAIHAAIHAVDHFSASIDAYHEQHIARVDVFRALDTMLSEGIALSLHVVGASADDPYLVELIADVRRTFLDAVPMLVNLTAPFGRARAWLTRKLPKPPAPVEVNPCFMAAWPVVGFDGTVVACGNDDALDRRPPHLSLGHVEVDDWSTIRARSLESPLLRAVRLYGPEYTAARFGEGPSCDGYCHTCMGLSEHSALAEGVAAVMAKASTALVESEARKLISEAGALAFARRQGVGDHANLITLGSKP